MPKSTTIWRRTSIQMTPRSTTRLASSIGPKRTKLGLKPDEPLKDKKVCASLKSKSWNAIQDGIDNLNRALQLRAEYDDAMAYMNLLYREKADLECDDPAARAADLKTADEWVDKTMAAKKAKAEKQPGAQGITMQPSQ